jgi:hypothetical protein
VPDMQTGGLANRATLVLVVPSRHVVAAGWTRPDHTRLRRRAGLILRGADTFSA